MLLSVAIRLRPSPSDFERRGLRCLAALLPVLAIALAAAAPAAAEGPDAPVLYEWKDASGTVRYTPRLERIPRQFRDAAVKLEPGRPATSPAPPSAAQPAAATPAPQPRTAERAPGTQETGRVAPPPATAEAVAESAAPATNAATGPASGASSRAAPTADGGSHLEARIRELEASIARDQELLLAMIGDPEGEELTDSAELREIAARLPDLQEDLANLRARRERGDQGAP